jgi:hypothetical protein
MPDHKRAQVVAGAIAAATLVSAATALGSAALFRKPTSYRVQPERACHQELATVHYPPGESGPARKRILVPGAPGLTATAVSSLVTRVDWTLAPVPAKCRAALLLLSAGHYSKRGSTWLPLTIRVPTRGALKGSTRITSSSSVPPPDVALASAETASGRRSRVAAVLIRR